MLSSPLHAMLKMYMTTYPPKLFPSDCITLQINYISCYRIKINLQMDAVSLAAQYYTFFWYDQRFDIQCIIYINEQKMVLTLNWAQAPGVLMININSQSDILFNLVINNTHCVLFITKLSQISLLIRSNRSNSNEDVKKYLLSA